MQLHQVRKSSLSRVTHLRCPSLGESLASFAKTLTLAVADTVHIVCVTVLAEVTELNNG